ncbi:hypothetical protein - conserved [Leishmania donovani]|uniref:Uncharacterized protein n=4 Tax=Leishmania donovani species complex TaxID=38574 RepID=A4I6W0_LEIIN|nr:hypothetical protein, unknown function [Leishmania infantum JPCM5]CAC9519938.1 hypothetical_protein_-_conserved [Leishmania infantum]CAJ1991386.1 hypothetical protein - conserved [Leishmania donovani]CAM70537.1 hypothetical protein, unknown function [Leishmania infantum JPCM5]SUZ44413.1 hypothetical_protein_-_conserved [Leishmania infantum]VDZ47230.1 hypothetical_protein_conserved [Leishmania donovani]|eukprot:XP_001467479.1 hypothetical protein, unknown function [Leishmania infantum JPCM5]
MIFFQYVFPCYTRKTASDRASLAERATTPSSNVASTTNLSGSATTSPGASRMSDLAGSIVSLAASAFFAFSVLVAIYYYFEVYRKRTTEERRILAHESGGRSSSGSGAGGPPMIHVIEGIPMHYSAASATQHESSEEVASLRRLAQASPAVIPRSSSVSVAYHVRSRGRDRTIRVHTLDADPHVFNPFSLPSSSVEAQACVGHVVETDEGEQRLLGGEETWKRLDYGSAMYYSSPIEESSHKDGSEGNEDDGDVAFCDDSENQPPDE